jgi:hypothetical protein
VLEAIEFPSEGALLRGRFYRQAGRRTPRGPPSGRSPRNRFLSCFDCCDAAARYPPIIGGLRCRFIAGYQRRTNRERTADVAAFITALIGSNPHGRSR